MGDIPNLRKTWRGFNWKWAPVLYTWYPGGYRKKFFVGWDRVWAPLDAYEGTKIWWSGKGPLILGVEGGFTNKISGVWK